MRKILSWICISEAFFNSAHNLSSNKRCRHIVFFYWKGLEAIQEVYKTLLVEISVAIGSLVKYSENMGMDRFRVTTTKQSALLKYVINKSDVVTALNVLSTSDREQAKNSLITMISDTIVSDSAIEASKMIFKNAKDKSNNELISFIATTMEGEPAGYTAVQIHRTTSRPVRPSFPLASDASCFKGESTPSSGIIWLTNLLR